MADAFASLPEREQSILILRLVLDLTDSEIGEALGLSPIPAWTEYMKSRLENKLIRAILGVNR